MPTTKPSQNSRNDYQAQSDGKVQIVDSDTFEHSWRVWCIFLSLCLLSFMSAIDATIITTSLPTITRDIGGAKDYVWIANSYLLSTTVTQLLYGQISNIFGRRNPMLVAISLFALGSGLAGGSTSPGMLIASRTVQGLGTGGLYVLSDIVICDIVPPRQRGPYLSAVLGTAAVGTTVGPIIGGALATASWRWVFYINLPIAGIGLVVMLLLLNVKYRRSPTWKHALARVDFLGNAIFIPSMTAIFFGLISGGVTYPWSSWRVIVPLVLGVLGCVVFYFHQASSICKEPSAPPRLFKHRTSAAGYIIIFLGALVLQSMCYFLPIYFQAVKETTPLRSGVDFLPLALAIMPFGALAGVFISKTGRYIPLHLAGFGLDAIAAGLFSILDSSSSTAEWVIFQLMGAAGSAIIFTATLPSTLAPLSESDVAVATATYSFVRSLGFAWGATIASIIFNGQVNTNLYLISNVSIREDLANGAAYSLASGGLIPSLEATTRQAVVEVYTKSLRIVWIVVAAISCLGFLCTFIEKHVELRVSHTTEFGLADKNTHEEEGKATQKGLTEKTDSHVTTLHKAQSDVE